MNANHSDFLKLDLQFFGDEDFEGFEDVETVETTETESIEPEETVEPEAQPQATEETELTDEQKAFLKIKYNKEEVPLDEEAARELAQKGMNYDKLQERLQQLETDPRLSFVEQLAQEQGLSVDDFITQYQEYREQERLNELVQQNIPEELAKEIMETRKMREEFKAKEQQQTEQEREKAELNDFFEYFRESNDREYDPKNDHIPDEVLEARANGVPLKYAFMEHHNQQLKNQIKVLKQNEQNKEKAPVSGVTVHGSDNPGSEDPFLMGFNSID